MKTQFYIFFLIFGLLSCNKEDVKSDKKEKQNEFFLQLQSRFLEAGIQSIIDDYNMTNTEKSMIRSNANFDNIDNIKVATFKVLYSDGSVLYGFQHDDGIVSAIKLLNNEKIEEVEADFSFEKNQFLVTKKSANAITEFAFDNDTKLLVKANDVNGVMNIKKVVSANCDALGARRKGETFGDCFERNWNNFCCDFTGCMAQIFFAREVAVAIALVCSCT